MATDEGDTTPSPLDGEVQEVGEPTDGTGSGPEAVVGSYTWDDFLREHGEATAARKLYQRFDETPGSERWGEEDRSLTPEDWERTDVDPTEYLGFPPWEIEARIGAAHRVAQDITDYSELIGYDDTPVIKDIYGWEDYKREYFYEENGEPPEGRFDDEPEEFDPEEALGLPPETIDATMADCNRAAAELEALVDERTVDVDEEVDEDAFFSDPQSRTTVANRYDLEKTVPMAKKSHFREEDRYWVNKPYSYVVIFRSTKENEIKYYVIQPHLTEIENELSEYLTDKLRASIKYEDEGGTAGDEEHRRSVIESKTRELLERYDLYEEPDESEERGGLGNTITDKFGLDPSGGISGRVVDLLGYEEPIEGVRELEGIEVRPEPALLDQDADILNEYQVEKLLYYLERDFIGYERIDGIKHDINVEDISCDGYNAPVFVYHSDYEQIITNVYHEEEELDDFVVKLAQRSGKGISKRRPQVDATLPDGSRAQLTLGREVSDHGTNYTIRQFKDVPFTPVDLINWQTFSLDQMAFLWLCIENHKSLIFAGGTASGKTTSLNAVSLFIPSNTKIVSIEDTREVELPQRNWIASVTRPSFSDDDKGDVDEFDLLEAALRQRPDYIVMGEIRGEEGRTLFQVMSTGHTTYTTFHADNVGEVLKRFTTEPINVSKTMFTALDLVSIQTSTRVQGHKVRRNKSLTEINHYDAENDEINVQDVYQWQAETDEFLKMGDSNTLDEIMFDRGWDREKLDDEIFKRQTVLAYLIHEGLNTYTQVAATFQAFINDPETILSLMANDRLEASLEDLREMESVLIDIDPEKEEMVPRPDPNEDIIAETEEILEEAEERLFEQYRGETPDDVADALIDAQPEPNVKATPDSAGELPEPDAESVADESAEIGEGEEGRAALDDGDETEERDDEGSLPELEPGDSEDPESADADTGEDTDVDTAVDADLDPDIEADPDTDESTLDSDDSSEPDSDSVEPGDTETEPDEPPETGSEPDEPSGVLPEEDDTTETGPDWGGSSEGTDDSLGGTGDAGDSEDAIFGSTDEETIIGVDESDEPDESDEAFIGSEEDTDDGSEGGIDVDSWDLGDEDITIGKAPEDEETAPGSDAGESSFGKDPGESTNDDGIPLFDEGPEDGGSESDGDPWGIDDDPFEEEEDPFEEEDLLGSEDPLEDEDPFREDDASDDEDLLEEGDPSDDEGPSEGEDSFEEGEEDPLEDEDLFEDENLFGEDDPFEEAGE